MSERAELLGTGDIAARFGLPISTVKRLESVGVLPAAQRIAGRRVWSINQIGMIERAIEARRVSRQSESGKAA